MPELSSAAWEVIRVFGVIALGGLGSLLGWRQISKVRALNANDDDERLRLTDAFAASQAARERAHKLSNEMMSMQRRMGRLEAENEACNARTARLEAENKTQAEQLVRLNDQVARLIRRNAETDLGKGLA